MAWFYTFLVVMVFYLHFLDYYSLVIFLLEPAPAAAQAVWIPSPQFNLVIEGQSGDNPFSLHTSQSNTTTTNSTFKARVDGIWSASKVNASLNMLLDETEASKSASSRPAFPSFASSQFRKQNDLLLPSLDDERKRDTITSCRLFGIDLKCPSFGSVIENPPLKPANNSDGSAEGCSGNKTSAGDSEDSSGLSRDSEDQKQEQLNPPPKEVHIKQISSTRSRTKVRKTKRESKLHFYMFVATPKTSIEIKII